MKFPINRSQLLWTWVMTFSMGMLAGILLMVALVPPSSPKVPPLPKHAPTFDLIDHCLRTTTGFDAWLACYRAGLKRLDTQTVSIRDAN